MSKSEASTPTDMPDRRMPRIGERRRTRRECYSASSDSIFEPPNDATIRASIKLSAALPLDCRPSDKPFAGKQSLNLHSCGTLTAVSCKKVSVTASLTLPLV